MKKLSIWIAFFVVASSLQFILEQTGYVDSIGLWYTIYVGASVTLVAFALCLAIVFALRIWRKGPLGDKARLTNQEKQTRNK